MEQKKYDFEIVVKKSLSLCYFFVFNISLSELNQGLTKMSHDHRSWLIQYSFKLIITLCS